MLPINKVKEILLRYEVLESSLSQSDIDKNTFVKNSKEYASIGDIIDDVKLYIKIINDQKSSEKILEDKSAEKELREIFENHSLNVNISQNKKLLSKVQKDYEKHNKGLRSLSISQKMIPILILIVSLFSIVKIFS